jgi:Haem-binding domain
MRKWLLRIGVGLSIGLVGIQFVSVERLNPTVESDVPMSLEVKGVIRRACYDCHSNETVWPWYSQVAPVSWLIARDVRFGRSKLNFSVWDNYNDRKKAGKLKEIISELKAGTMPPSYYALVHVDAALSAYEQELIIEWARNL